MIGPQPNPPTAILLRSTLIGGGGEGLMPKINQESTLSSFSTHTNASCMTISEKKRGPARIVLLPVLLLSLSKAGETKWEDGCGDDASAACRILLFPSLPTNETCRWPGGVGGASSCQQALTLSPLSGEARIEILKMLLLQSTPPPPPHTTSIAAIPLPFYPSSTPTIPPHHLPRYSHRTRLS